VSGYQALKWGSPPADTGSVSSPLRLVVLLALALGTVAPAFLAVAGRADAETRLHPVTGTLHTKVGIADQKKDMFDDARFLGLGVKYSRRSVSWDVTRDPRLTADLDDWLQGARAAHVEPLITFARSHREGRRRIQPTAAQYEREMRAFKRRWPWVRAFSTWNEVNLPGEGPASNPKLVGSYYRILKRTFPTSKILAADLLDLPSMVTWVKRFQRVNRIQPRYWGLHNYVTANRFQVERTKRLLQATTGEIWITEVGGLVARRNRTLISLPQGKSHAAEVTRFIFDKLARLDARVTRVYAYHWDSSSTKDTWDSAFIGPDDKERPAFAVFRRVLGQVRPAG
jgi:polysaccharide biosynthesis protein PslG